MTAAVEGLPIRRRLIRSMLLASGAVLLLAAAALFTRELLLWRATGIQQLSTLGRVIAANSTAALAFDNREDGESVLDALRADPNIVAAALYDADGALFATYPRATAASALPARPDGDSYRVQGGHLLGYEPVVEGGRRMGTLYVRSSMSAARDRLWLYAQMLVGVVAASGLFAYLLSRRLQHGISRPLLSLADAATAVSRHDEYTLPREHSGITEIERLTVAFGAMLDEIRESEARMRAQLGALSLLQRITHAIGMRHDLHEIFDIVLPTLERDMPLDLACVCLREPGAESFRVTAMGPAGAALADRTGLNIGALLEDAAAGDLRAARLIYDADTQACAEPIAQRAAAAGLASLVLTPLPVENQVFGVLLVARRRRDAFTSPECEFLRQLGEHVALASHQARLHGDLKQAYDDLRQSQSAVLQQERLRALGQMASGIAHDINNAMSPVSLYTESLLEREPSLSPRAREYLTTIQRAIEDVASTVARMREFYRPRETQLTLERIDVNRTVEQVLQLTHARWSNQPQERGVYVELRKDLSIEPVQIMAAEGELRDALTNLIFNAVDAMPEGGVLTVRTRAVPSEDGWPRVDIEIGDTGIGMDEETRRRCLEPFFTTKGERGTGLGLAMVYGAVQRHSAELHIDSEPGRGTTFRLSFAGSGAAVDATQSLRVPPELPPRQHILLVDDDPVLLKSLTDILEADGHRVKAAGGGEAGIAAFDAALRTPAPFTFVITDLGMPHVDGRRVAAGIKARSRTTPVVMLTGWGQRMLAEGDVPPHVDVVLSKPPRVKELRATIMQLTRGAGGGLAQAHGALA